jgi:hypothetical protein
MNLTIASAPSIGVGDLAAPGAISWTFADRNFAGHAPIDRSPFLLAEYQIVHQRSKCVHVGQHRSKGLN